MAPTDKLFTSPENRLTEDYITGRFGWEERMERTIETEDGPAGRSTIDERARGGAPGPRAIFDRQLDQVKDDVLRLGALRRAGARARGPRPRRSATSSWPTRCAGTTPRSTSCSARSTSEITAVIATQAPVARDIRELLALYHAAAELERMGDYAVNIAKLAQQLASEPEKPILRQIPRMEQLCREQLRAAMRALVDVSESEARRSRSATTSSTSSTTASTRTSSAHTVAPERARQAIHMLFAAHHLERLGDRVTNIGEDVVYLATGQIEDLNN